MVASPHDGAPPARHGDGGGNQNEGLRNAYGVQDGVPVSERWFGPPATLGSTAAAGVRVIVWCKACRHQIEPDPAEMAARYGADTSVLDWRERLGCSLFGGRQGGMGVDGARGRKPRAPRGHPNSDYGALADVDERGWRASGSPTADRGSGWNDQVVPNHRVLP